MRTHTVVATEPTSLLVRELIKLSEVKVRDDGCVTP